MPVQLRVRVRRPAIRASSLERLSRHILEAAGEAGAVLSVEVIGDGRMRRLNRRYRRRDATTDVLAFPMREGPGPASPLLGDVVISLPVAVRQAAERGHSLERELAVLLVHGVLHLCGYDHERGARGARRMRHKERVVLRKLGPLPRLLVR